MDVNIHYAKTHLSRLLHRLAAGAEITIARAGVPVARLVSIEPKQAHRPLDLDRGLFEVLEDFDAPLPAEALADCTVKPTKGGRRSRWPGRIERR